MPFSYAQYAGNGSTTTFSVPFPYLLKAHVKLYTGYNILDGTFASQLAEGTGYAWISATQVQTTVALATGTTLTILRDTPDGSQVVVWNDGSNLISNDQNTADLQNLYVVQEQQDRNDVVAAQQAAATLAANSALAASSAAVTTANSASTTANGLAASIATANTNASAAVTTANSASTTANGLAASIATANTNASAAVTTANSASTTANSLAASIATANTNASAAVTTANSASATANSAETTANSVASSAASAQATANAAQSTATAALPKAGGTMAGDIAFAPSQGYPRIPQNSRTSSYTLLAADAGRHVSITTGGVTVPSGVFGVGDAVTVYNDSGSPQAITQGASVTLRQAGTTSTGNRTLAAYGIATLLCVASNTFVISGAGLT